MAAPESEYTAPMWILALDVGTSSIWAIGYDALGRPLPGADARVGPPGRLHDSVVGPRVS